MLAEHDARTHCRAPRRSRSTEVTSRRVPSQVGDTVVFDNGKLLNVGSRLRSLTASVINGEVKVPELDVKLGSGSDSGEHNVTTLGRPEKSVGNLVLEALCDISFD